jgi:hypothetical protein
VIHRVKSFRKNTVLAIELANSVSVVRNEFMERMKIKVASGSLFSRLLFVMRRLFIRNEE